MRKLFFGILYASILCFYTCDNSEIIDTELNFDGTIKACQGVSSLILYKTNTAPSESLSIKIGGLTITDLLPTEDNTVFEGSYNLSSTNTLNYITYANENLPSNLFCSDIPLSELQITDEKISTSGEVQIKTTLINNEYIITVQILNFDLTILSQDVLDFGTLDSSFVPEVD